jgi:hypothetical protein
VTFKKTQVPLMDFQGWLRKSDYLLCPRWRNNNSWFGFTTAITVNKKDKIERAAFPIRLQVNVEFFPVARRKMGCHQWIPQPLNLIKNGYLIACNIWQSNGLLGMLGLRGDHHMLSAPPPPLLKKVFNQRITLYNPSETKHHWIGNWKLKKDSF